MHGQILGKRPSGSACRLCPGGQCSISKLFSFGWPLVARKYVSADARPRNYVQPWLMAPSACRYLVKRQTQEVFPWCMICFKGCPFCAPSCLAISQSGEAPNGSGATGDAVHRTASLYTKFEVLRSSLQKILRIFRLSINRPSDLDLWSFDL